MTLYPRSAYFWSARSAFYYGRKAAQAKSRRIHAAVSLARQETKWAANTGRYLRGYTGVTKEFVKVDRRLAEDAAAWIAEIQPVVIQEMDRYLGRIAMDAFGRWPVSSGLSKSMLDLSFEVRGEDLVGRVSSLAPYDLFIKSGGRRPSRELIAKPGKAAVLEFGKAVLDKLGGAR